MTRAMGAGLDGDRNQDARSPRDIGERSYAFALRIVRVANAIPHTVSGAVIARQIMRSGTSIGANVHEAKGSSSRKEYCRRIKIARAEARETLYWLRLAGDSELLPKDRLSEMVQEADELMRILTTIGKRTE